MERKIKSEIIGVDNAMIVTKQAHSDGNERKKWRDGWRERKIMIEGRREGG